MQKTAIGNKLAAIDIGSNSILLVIISCDGKGDLSVLKEDVKTPRIADHLNPKKRKASLKRLAGALKDFKKQCEKFHAKRIFCVGTEALRRNPDKKKIVRYMQKNTGIKIRIISPFRESGFSYVSATEELAKKKAHASLVVDIGAGSTEITWTAGARFFSISLSLGALALKNEMRMTYPLSDEKIRVSRQLIRRKLKRKVYGCVKRSLAGVGGTVTAIPSILLGLKKYDPKKLDFKTVKKSRIEDLIDRLKVKDIRGLKKTAGMPKGRADILLPGLLILSEIMRIYGSSSILVRNRGIRFGILFDHLRKLYPSTRFRILRHHF